jgi:hypothetical protein
MIVDCWGGHLACQEKLLVANDNGLLRWTSCMSREIGSEVLLIRIIDFNIIRSSLSKKGNARNPLLGTPNLAAGQTIWFVFTLLFDHRQYAKKKTDFGFVLKLYIAHPASCGSQWWTATQQIWLMVMFACLIIRTFQLVFSVRTMFSLTINQRTIFSVMSFQ